MQSSIAARLRTLPPTATAAAAAVTVAFVFLLSRVTRMPGTDDYAFAEHIAQFPSAWAWISERYATWSGRVVPEAWLYVYSGAPLWWWQVTAAVLTLLFLALLLGIAALVDPRALSAPVILVSGGLLFLMDDTVLHGGYLWVTGAMNYFWAVPFALAAIYPMLRLYLRDDAPRPWILMVAALSGLVAAVSSEQVGAVLAVLFAVALVDRLLVAARGGSRRNAAAVGMLFTFALAGFLVLMLAPGNALRSEFDAEYWLPEFFEVPLSTRLHSAVRFVVDGLVNRTGVALPAIWMALLTIALRRQGESPLMRGAVGLTALTGLALTVLHPLNAGNRLFDLKATWRAPLDGWIDSAVLVMWILILVATALSPLLLLRSYGGWLLSLLIAAGIASLAVITTSASMYASGPRVVFIPSLLLLLCFYGLFLIATRKSTLLRRAGTVAVVVIAVVQYAYVLSAITSQVG